MVFRTGAQLEDAQFSPKLGNCRAWLRYLSVFLLVNLVTAVAGYAQLAGKGTISGTVTDPTGAVIPDASIVATNIATNVKQTTKSTSSGDFNLSVDAGNYTVVATAPGFKTTTQENVHINALESVVVNLHLAAGSASETVTVTDAPPPIETSNATLGSTMEQEMYAALPVLQAGTQRRPTDFISLMPGVNAQPTNGGLDTNTGVINGSGSRGAVSSVYINGIPITSVAGEGDPRFIWTAFPMDSIKQFQVQTAGYSAVYEGQGVVNYTSQSGTNKLHGGLYDYFRNTALDTWGFMAPASSIKDSAGNVVIPAQKPVEHQNEYGIYAGFPIIKDKLFFFGSYEGYRYIKGPNYQWETIPTTAMRSGDFSAAGYSIYDPATTVCTASSCTRAQFSSGGTKNVIPASRLSSAAKYMQQFLPAPTNSNISNNYLSGYSTGLNNWMTASRIDWSISPSHTFSALISFGRQATTAPSALSGSIASSKSQTPPPYISQQQYAPKTKVFLFEDTYVFSPHVVNQLKYGYGRYDGPGWNQNIGAKWAATAAGIAGLPAGQASDSMPTVTFSGNANSMNIWGGYSSNRSLATGYVLLDNVQWTVGKHAFTFGGELAWMQYNYTVNLTGVNPLQLTFNSSETANYKSGTTTKNTSAGYSYASYMLGAANQGTFTLSAVPETGARFRPVSPYVQDEWKVNSKLTLNLGLRWDIYPGYREVKDRISWMDPNATNALTGNKGALAFGGSGSGRCNCSNNVKDYYKNFGPRIGFAYQSDPHTVWRGSYGVYFTHGNNVGGSAQSRQGPGLMGYSVSPKTTTVDPSAGAGTITNPVTGSTGTALWEIDNPFPSYTAPPTLDSTLGTYYTTASSAASQTVNYADPYLGGRAPEYMNWSFGLQRQLTSSMTLTMSYVGSRGRFTYMDSNNARGIWSNQLDPKYLSLGNQLSNKATDANLAKAGVTKPFSTFSPSTGTITQALKPFPQYSAVTDAFGFVGTTDYNSLQVSLQQRLTNGLTFMANYTWSRSMDNAGTTRSGYDIPAAYAADGKFHKARSLDRSLSLSDQPHRIVLIGAYDLPFGKGHIGSNSFWVRSLAGGWKTSGIFQANSGSPLSIQANTCNTNPAQNACYPLINPSFTGNVKINGSYGNGATAASLSTRKYIDSTAFSATPDYTFSTIARTAPLNLRNAGLYNLDLSVRRAFSLAEKATLTYEADAFNVTNHTRFGWSGTSNGTILSWGSSSFGTVGVQNSSRDIQMALRLEF